MREEVVRRRPAWNQCDQRPHTGRHQRRSRPLAEWPASRSPVSSTCNAQTHNG